MFSDDSAALEILLEFGLSPAADTTWEHDHPEPAKTLEYQLMTASAYGNLERVRLLLESGVDPAYTSPDGNAAWTAAWRHGHRDVADLLRAAGAPTVDLDSEEQLVSAILAGQTDEVDALIASDADLLGRALERFPDTKSAPASQGNLGGLRVLLALGVSMDLALHQALWHGQVEAAKLLLDGGADTSVTDASYSADAAGWARHGGHPAAIALVS